MKKKFLVFCLLVFSVPCLPLKAQVPQTAEEMRAILFISNLSDILAKRSLTRDELDSETFTKLLEEEQNEFFGGISDVGKYSTLKELCELIVLLPPHEKTKLIPNLVEVFADLTVLEGKPKDWNEIRIRSAGGSLGLITDCLLEIADQSTYDKMLELAVTRDEVMKVDLLLDRARIAGKTPEFLKSKAQMIPAARSEEMKSLLKIHTGKSE